MDVLVSVCSFMYIIIFVLQKLKDKKGEKREEGGKGEKEEKEKMGEKNITQSIMLSSLIGSRPW